MSKSKKQQYNLGLAYYSHYYQHLTDLLNPRAAELSRANAPLFQYFNPDGTAPLQAPGLRAATRLKTTYPGLVIGTGYAHGIGAKEGDEFKMGFHFDHTSGHPAIPGSSIKGAIRSVFPMRWRQLATKATAEAAKAAIKAEEAAAKMENATVKDKDDATEVWQVAKDQRERKQRKADALLREAEGREQYIIELLQELFGMQGDGAQVQCLEQESFAGQAHHFNDASQAVLIPPSQRDVFFDATLTDANDGKPYLFRDFLTPHKNRDGDGIPDEMKNPLPIQFLKVLPEIQFGFRFRLLDDFTRLDYKDGKVTKNTQARILSGEQREQLFRRILLDWGVGAKTKSGYGQFSDQEPTTPPRVETPSAEPTPEVTGPGWNDPKPQRKNPVASSDKIKSSHLRPRPKPFATAELYALIVNDPKGKFGVKLKFLIEGADEIPNKRKKTVTSADYAPGDLVLCKIKADDKGQISEIFSVTKIA